MNAVRTNNLYSMCGVCRKCVCAHESSIHQEREERRSAACRFREIKKREREVGHRGKESDPNKERRKDSQSTEYANPIHIPPRSILVLVPFPEPQGKTDRKRHAISITKDHQPWVQNNRVK